MKFNISEGHFSSGIHIGIHFGRVSQTYKVRFDSSCLYDDLNWERDYNKLMGWSYSNLPFYYEPEEKWQTPHHNNSIRLAWRANKQEGSIELAAYYYQDGVRHIEYLCNVFVDTDYTIGLFYKFDELDSKKVNPRLIVTISNSPFFYTKTIALTKPFDTQWSYKLYPYFGGSEPAPHHMIIYSTET